MELPPEVLETMRCGLCQNYLSIPPIITVTSDDKKHRCGRCTHIETRISNRNILYEKMAQIATFPCTFPHCEEKLKWGTVEDHEKICEKRTMRCPVSWKCEEIIRVEDIITHCGVSHRRNVANDSLTSPVEPLGGKRRFTVILLVKDDIPFLVYTVSTSRHVWVNIFSLYPQKTSFYKLELVNESNECCLSFRNKIVPYDPREHCKRCALNDCTDNLHEGKVADLDEYASTRGYQKINRELLAELNLKETRYTVEVEEKDPVENGNIDEESVDE